MRFGHSRYITIIIALSCVNDVFSVSLTFTIYDSNILLKYPIMMEKDLSGTSC